MSLNKEDFTQSTKHSIINATSQIVSGYLSNNKLETSAIPKLIEDTYKTLTLISAKQSSYTHQPFTEVENSIQPDFLICLEDGKKLKMLKRYLKTKYNMTENEYRQKWDLPKTYPMIAPNYAKTRSKLAKKNGLGKDKK